MADTPPTLATLVGGRPARLLITGLRGTLAPKLAEAARADGLEVLSWPRHAPDFQPARAMAQLRPDAVAHLGTADAAASGELAALAAAHEIPFLFTSTAMVFDAVPDGPHRPGDTRTARDDYGRSKIACEDAVRRAHPRASIVRLGWQIDPQADGNNMLRALDDWQARRGEIAASRRWIPACSFMDDTARGLLRLILQPGVHHMDANARCAWTFPRIVDGLRRLCGRTHWQVRETDDYHHDQRLVDGPELPSIADRLAPP